MKKIFVSLLGSLLVGAAAAAELPSEGEIVLVSEGSVVGVGEFDDGNLELRLLVGFEGDVTVEVTDDEGNLYTFDATVDSDSSVTLEGLDLEELVEESDGTVEITVREHLEGSGNMAFGAGVPEHVDLPDVALEGQERAEENHEAAPRGARARGEAEADAEFEAGEKSEAEAKAGASASVGVGLGNR